MKYEDLKKKIESVKIELDKTQSDLTGLRDQRDVILKQATEDNKVQARPLNERIRQLEEQLQELQAQCEVHPNFKKNWGGICPACKKYISLPDDGLRAHM